MAGQIEHDVGGVREFVGRPDLLDEPVAGEEPGAAQLPPLAVHGDENVGVPRQKRCHLPYSLATLQQANCPRPSRALGFVDLWNCCHHYGPGGSSRLWPDRRGDCSVRSGAEHDARLLRRARFKNSYHSIAQRRKLRVSRRSRRGEVGSAQGSCKRSQPTRFPLIPNATRRVPGPIATGEGSVAWGVLALTNG